jgi:hypothetical protein
MGSDELRRILGMLDLSLTEVSRLTRITGSGLRNCLEDRRRLKPHEADRIRQLLKSMEAVSSS